MLSTCSICNKISASGEDHLDCVAKRRIELEDGELKESLPEKLDIGKDPDNVAPEIRALLEYMAREKS